MSFIARSRPGSKPARASGLLRRFAGAEDGATAIEFGFVALPFLFLMFAILELAMIFWSTQTLESAVANAARQIYTGQFQTSSSNQNKTSAQLAAAFKTAVCNNVTSLFDCPNQVSVDIRNASTFSGATPPSPVSNGAYDASSYTYQAIGPNQIGIVTASFQYTTIVKMLASTTTLANGNRLIMATSTFRTEPYTN